MIELPSIKTIVTYMELLDLPVQPCEINHAYYLQHEICPDVQWYLNLYREIGRNYIWNYRPGQSIQEVKEIIQSGNTEIYTMHDDGCVAGMVELDISNPASIEIVHFGLLPAFTEKGKGKNFLQLLIGILGTRNIKRIWLSTCGLDHPDAIHFYQNAGFKVFQTKESSFLDYRYSDFYSLADAPQIPHGVEYFNCQQD